MKEENTDDASCEVVPDAVEVFQSAQKDEEMGHCIVTILCTLKSEEVIKKYLSLTRSIVIPKKASHPSCIRVTQTIPQNTEEIQVLWIQEWLKLSDFKGVMKDLFKEGSPINEVNELLVCNPVPTFTRLVKNEDVG